MPRKITLATTSLAGCFGCHMSLLDIDLVLLDLVDHVEILRSPLTDIKTFNRQVDVGLIEGGVCNDENLHVLREFRKNCNILVSVGECAIMGGLPALRNDVPLQECLSEAYLNGPTVSNPQHVIPHDPHLPKILDRIYPCHELVKVDVFLPGCPPPAKAFFELIASVLEGKNFQLSRAATRFD
ncbi:MAG: NADP oxidoreductase [Bdellovibrio sp.]|nr:MAG: NADP oxidoreductase [Bdellovibrio sp.]